MDKALINTKGRTEWEGLINEWVHNEVDRQMLKRRLLDGVVNNNKEMLEKLGVLLPDGTIDIDTAYRLIKDQAIKQGKVTQNIPMIGDVIFSVDDVEIFYRICKEYV